MRSRSNSLLNFINSECVAKYPLIESKKDLDKFLFNLRKTNLRLARQRDSLRLTTCFAVLLASFIALPKKKFISDNFSKKSGTFNILKINKPPKSTLLDIKNRYLPQQIRNYYLLLAYSYLGYFEIEAIRPTSSGLKRIQYLYAQGRPRSCLSEGKIFDLKVNPEGKIFNLKVNPEGEASCKAAFGAMIPRIKTYASRKASISRLKPFAKQEVRLSSCFALAKLENTASGSVVVLAAFTFLLCTSSYASAASAKQEGKGQQDRLTCFATGGRTKLVIESSNLASYIPFSKGIPSSNNNKDLLISFSAGQDSVTLLILLFGIQSQSSLKLNLLWNHHLWHKDSFFITRHVLKLSFLFKTSSHSVIAIAPVKTELQARQWRLKAARRLSNFYKYQNVMQAHSGTDKIETLLLNLFRGTGNISPFHSSDFPFNFSQAQKRKLFF